MVNRPNFISLIDAWNRPYFSYDVSLIEQDFVRPLNASEVGINYCTFLADEIPISRHATGPFSLDLTDRDDIILAILSIILILLIEGILTSILLRTNRGKVDSFAFSIKYFLDLARGLKFSNLLQTHRKGQPSTRKFIDVKLLIVAGLVVATTLGLEVFILMLSTPQLRDVSNTDNAFQIKELENPDWNQIQRKLASGLSRPCSTVRLSLPQLEQGPTQITSCVSLNMKANQFQLSLANFATANIQVNYTIESYVHEFGAEHIITIANVAEDEEPLRAKYFVRAYYVLHDLHVRIMTKRRFHFNFEQRVEALHMQFIAFLFTEYKNRRKDDDSVTLERLNNLNFSFSTENGPLVNVIQLQQRQRYRQVASVKHVTKVTGLIPRGPEALAFAQVVFKGAYGLGLSGPDRYDLILGTGQTPPRPSVAWQEVGRTLNWLSLSIAVCVAAVLLVLSRILFKPAGTAEIAFLYFATLPGAAGMEQPLRLSPEDAGHFRMSRLSELTLDSFSDDSLERGTALSEYSDSCAS